MSRDSVPFKRNNVYDISTGRACLTTVVIYTTDRRFPDGCKVEFVFSATGNFVSGKSKKRRRDLDTSTRIQKSQNLPTIKVNMKKFTSSFLFCLPSYLKT